VVDASEDRLMTALKFWDPNSGSWKTIAALQGPPGENGQGLNILGEMDDPGDLPGAADTNDTIIIDGHFWVYTDSGVWIDAGLVGGPPGPAGPAGSVAIEAWHNVGNTGAGEPAFGTGCSAGSPIPQFRKDPNGIVRMRGMINVSGQTNPVIFTLPVGYRPEGDVRLVAPAAGATVPVLINTGGVITVFSPGAWVQIDQLIFPTAGASFPAGPQGPPGPSGAINYMVSRQAATENGTSGTPLNSANNITIPAGKWLIRALGCVVASPPADMVGLAVWNSTTGAEVPDSLSPAGYSSGAPNYTPANLSTEFEITVAANTVLRPRARPHGSSTPQFLYGYAGGTPANVISALRLAP